MPPSTGAGILSCDRARRVLGANRTMLAQLRRARTEVIGLPLNSGGTTLEHFLDDLVTRVVTTGQPLQEEFAVPASTWNGKRYRAVLVPILDAEGVIAGVSGTVHEAQGSDGSAEVHRAEVLCSIAEELFLEEEQRSSLANVFQRIARAVGADAYIQHSLLAETSNLRAEAAHGLSPHQIAALAEIRSSAPAIALLTRGLPHLVDGHGKPPSPAAITLSRAGILAYTCCPLQISGRVFGAVTFTSRTRRHLDEGDLRFLQAACDLVAASIDRARLLCELRVSRDLAEQASRAKDNFLAVLSHELRTPLNPVLLLASSAAANPSLPAAVRADFELIARNVALETRLIDDLLDLTRITHDKLSLHKQNLDLHTILSDALTTVGADVKEKNLHLAVELTATPVHVRGDSVRLQQVFWNLLKNAVKFTPTAGRIRVRTSTPSSEVVRVEIIDTGIGLTPDETARAFDCFAQGNHARDGSSGFGGLGLGLSITRKLVSLHGGSIEVTSAGRDQGACFAVELPLATRHSGDDAAATRRVERHGCPAGTRILLVEDHQPTRQALLQLLVHRHYEVIAAGSVAEARAIAHRKRFDLVISDIGLPDGTGYELMAALQREFGLCGVALTGYGSEQDLALARSAGFVAHLTKPVSIQALESALAAVTGTPS